MAGALQQAWDFSVGDGQTPEVFTRLEGLYNFPDFIANLRTIRDATTIDVARTQDNKRFCFNKQTEGHEFNLEMEYLPKETAQARVNIVEGDDAGNNFEFSIDNGTTVETWAFTAIVYNKLFTLSESNDQEGKDMVSYTFKVVSDVIRTEV